MNKSNLTAWERWELASLDDGTPPKRPPLRAREAIQETEEAPPPEPEVHVPTAEEVEQIHRQAHDSGYQEGHAEGLRVGHQEGYDAGFREGRALGEEAARHLMTVAGKLDAALTGLDQSVAEELTALALEVAREVLRQTLATHPETVVGVVRDALTHLPHQHANIYLHPDDASLVRSYAGDQLSHAGHRIHEDARLQRNDVTIEAGGAHVDATLVTRWRRVVETLGQTVEWDGKPLVPPMPVAEETIAALPPMTAEAPLAEEALPDAETTVNLDDTPATAAAEADGSQPEAWPEAAPENGLDDLPVETPVAEPEALTPTETDAIEETETVPPVAEEAAEAEDDLLPDQVFSSDNPIADLTDDTPLPGVVPASEEDDEAGKA